MDFVSSPGLYTDMYQLIMAQGYLSTNKAHLPTTFDYFFRKNPFEGGYTIFAGLGELLDILPSFTYSDRDTAYLFSLGNFTSGFLGYLNNFKFKGSIFSVKEGEVVFPNEPLIRVEGTWLECQLLETLLLNIVNFQSLIATKASRIRQVAGGKTIIDMGLRRAQGLGGLWASKAAIIGGVNSTSNVLSAKDYDLNPTGTMAHSWIQGHDSELEAFRQFAKVYPDSTTLLVDTYNTLKSGIPNAIIVAKDMEKDGLKLKGVRLDSGDFSYLSKKVRQMLDNAGLQYVRIVASNQLDEYVIRSLEEQKAPIDVFGVGTNLAVGAGAGAHDGVYKLSSCQYNPKMKFSENIAKQSLPGPKDIYRFYGDNSFYADGITCQGIKAPEKIFDPVFPDKNSSTWQLKSEPLLQQFVKNGEIVTKVPTAVKSAEYVTERLKLLSDEHKRFENPHIFKVGISQILMKLRDDYVKAYSKS
jgi:nicotinate phosphoribosyltransferase